MFQNQFANIFLEVHAVHLDAVCSQLACNLHVSCYAERIRLRSEQLDITIGSQLME